MTKDCRMDQTEHVNKHCTKEIVKNKVWVHIKRLQKKDLAYSKKEGTVCQIIMSSETIQWPTSCEEEEDKKWYYETHVGPYANMALQEMMSACNDATREQYKCE